MGNKEIINNTSYTPWLEDKHNQDFLENNTVEIFLKKTNKIRSDIHEDYLKRFDEYTKDVLDILNNKYISVAASRIIDKENNLVANKFLEDTEKLPQILPKTVLEYTNNRTYAWKKFPQDLSDVAA